VDINCAWDRKLAFKHIPLIKNYKIKVVEQPMMPNEPDLADFAGIMQKEGVILMADESACSLGDMEKIAKEGYYKMRGSFFKLDVSLANQAFFLLQAECCVFSVGMPFTMMVPMMNTC